MPTDYFNVLLNTPPELTEQDQARINLISSAVPGYSDARQYGFFKHVFAHTPFERVLIVGVYFGRDIIFMADAAARTGRQLTITGVDKFSDDACADWPVGLEDCSWEQAGFGRAPTLAATRANIDGSGYGGSVRLVQQHDDAFLANCRDRFDFIYLDTAHDENTVRRQLTQAAPLLTEHGLLAGDDYSDQGTWGVRKALQAAAPGHAVFSGWVWLAGRQHVEAAATALAI